MKAPAECKQVRFIVLDPQGALKPDAARTIAELSGVVVLDSIPESALLVEGDGIAMESIRERFPEYEVHPEAPYRLLEE